MPKAKRIIWGTILTGVIVLLYWHQVPRSTAAGDWKLIVSLEQEIIEAGLSTEAGQLKNLAQQLHFSDQLLLVKVVQNFVQSNSPPKGKKLPADTQPGLQSLFEQPGGMCYDRAYAIEILLRHLGFETRRVAIYQEEPEKANWREMFTRGIRSHAASEVCTKKGWMMVESDYAWVGLQQDSTVVAYADLPLQDDQWMSAPPSKIAWQLEADLLLVYGLYARHGKFYPPYNSIPDVNWLELGYNLLPN